MTSLLSEVDYWHFEGDTLVFKDGSLGAAFKLNGFDISCASEDQVNQLSRNLENLLLSCQEGIKMQVFYKLSPNVEPILRKHEALSNGVNGAYRQLVDARSKFIQANQASGLYFSPEVYFFIRSAPNKAKKRGLFGSQKKYENMVKKDFDQKLEKFERIVHQIQSALNSSQLSPLRINSAHWYELIFDYFNQERAESIGLPRYRSQDSDLNPSLLEQLSLTDAFVNKDCIEIGKRRYRCISMALLPEGQTFISMANLFNSMPFHFWMSQSIEILENAKERSSLEMKRRIAHSMASGSKNVSDLESENKLGHIEALLGNLLEGSDRLVSGDLTLIIWGDSVQDLDYKTDEVLKAFRNLNQAEGIQETLAGKQAFLAAAPGICKGLRQTKMKSSNAAHLMPIYAGWEGNPKPVCLLPTRDGRLFSLDPYADHLPSWNGIVFGGSGSGKSYTVVQLMAMFYGKVNRNNQGEVIHPRIVWIDNGASSKRLIEVLDGEFIDLSLKSKLRINMFDLDDSESKPSLDRIRTVMAVLEMILKDENHKSLGKREKALLEEQVLKVYETVKGRTPELSDLKTLLDAHNDEQMRKFGEVLYSWTGSSAYGQILDGQTNVKLSKDLVSIEVQELSNYPDLKDVLLLLLTSYIQDVASSDIEREYLLIIDEAERLFQSELARQVVITCYRTWRKFKSGIWCLSQNYKDFMADKSLKDALMTNTTSVIILRQRKIDWKDFQKTFDFNDTQVERIKSLEIRKGEFSEFFYLQDENQAILRLIPEPLSHWISTSDANDKVRIKEVLAGNPQFNLLDALCHLAFSK